MMIKLPLRERRVQQNVSMARGGAIEGMGDRCPSPCPWSVQLVELKLNLLPELILFLMTSFKGPARYICWLFKKN